MQLIVKSAAADYAVWKAAFESESENIANAGLSTLQIWHVVGGGVAVLFAVNDQAAAQAWLDRQTALGRGVDAIFLKTA